MINNNINEELHDSWNHVDSLLTYIFLQGDYVRRSSVSVFKNPGSSLQQRISFKNILLRFPNFQWSRLCSGTKEYRSLISIHPTWRLVCRHCLLFKQVVILVKIHPLLCQHLSFLYSFFLELFISVLLK